MELVGYTCPECGGYAASLQGHRRADGVLSVRCPSCGEIEEMQKYRGTLGAVAE